MSNFLYNYYYAAEECSAYIFESESEQLAYKEHIKSGKNPRDHIIYQAAIVLGKDSEFQNDINEYEKSTI